MANWKMNLSIKESLELAKKVKQTIKNNHNTIVLCPDFLALPFIGPILKGSSLYLGAQDSAAFNLGAYTGEVAATNLKSLGVKYAIIGHSERRLNLHEEAPLINQKIKIALETKLIPVLCLGESWQDKKAGVTKKYLQTELRQALKNIKIKTASDLIIAYEPVWAISTNKQAKPMSPVEAEAIHIFLKQEAKKILHQDVAVIYGGSVKADNAASFLSQKNIAGLLVGGASLKAEEFAAIFK